MIPVAYGAGMALRASLTAGLARQLSLPHGIRGAVVARTLNSRNRAAVAAAVAALEVAPGQWAADLVFGGGVGIGLLLSAVGEAGQVVGVDLSASMVRRAARRYRAQVRAGRVQLHAASMTDLPLPAGALDRVMSLNTFYFLAEPDRACAELSRVTAPGGRVVIGIGDPTAMTSGPFADHAFRIRPVADIVALLSASGLAVLRDERVGSGDSAYHLLVCAPDGSATGRL